MNIPPRPPIQAMLAFLILPQLALGVSLHRTSRSEAVLQGWVPNACTLIICAPAQGNDNQELPESQELWGPTKPPATLGSNGDKGNAGSRGVILFPELDLLKTQMKELEKQLDLFKAAFTKTQKVLLKPNGAMVGEKIFKTDGSRGDFDTANASCTRMGGTLALPRDAEENTALQQIVAWHNRHTILGTNDMAKEGSFVDQNGQALGFSNWAPGEPNSHGNENCVEMHPDGKWHDRNCDLDWLIICEF